MFRLIYGGSFRSVGVVTMDTAFEKLEFPKILSAAANYAVLERGKELTMATLPADSLAEANASLALTEECVRLLFDYGVGKIEYFPPFGDEFERAAKGATLSERELLVLRAAAALPHAKFVEWAAKRPAEEIFAANIKKLSSYFRNLL